MIHRNGIVKSSDSLTIFPQPQEVRKNAGEYILDSTATIVVEDDACLELAVLLQEQLKAWLGRQLPIEMGRKDTLESHIFISLSNEKTNAEGYELSISDRGVILTGNDRSGVIYGSQTLLQLCYVNVNNDQALPYVDIRDWPNLARRGVHVYMPPRDKIEGFKRMLQTLAHLKMNTIFIEVGAGMEYEKYPEINTTWEQFCREVYAYPGGPEGIQGSQAYWKDSIHPELAGGSYLTKAEVRDIVQYAKHLGFFVIPEIQALSHAYYLTLPFREIAERPQEPYPDTYCPSNPRSYEIYFDVAEEVLEVFEPEWVSIGHDEIRILGECPLCQDKTGEDLLAYEINKLYDFYTAKGIKIIMWAEKLQNLVAFDGRAKGGVFQEKTDDQGRYWRQPATYKAIDMVPKDIIMLDWYHKLTHDTEVEFYEKGFETIMFGNFHGSMFLNSDLRLNRPGVIGAEVSTWCTADEYEISRNGWMYEFVYSAGILWGTGKEKTVWEEEDSRTIEWMPAVKAMLQNADYATLQGNMAGFQSLYSGMNNGDSESALPVNSMHWPQGNQASQVFHNSGSLSAIPEEAGEIDVSIGTKLKSIIFTHAAVERIEKWIASWAHRDMSTYIFGNYEVLYEDGSTEEIEIHYGIQIGPVAMEWGRTLAGAGIAEYDIDDEVSIRVSELRTVSPYYSPLESWRGSLVYFTIPVKLETGEGTKTAFIYEWVNPYPNKVIQSLRFVPNDVGGSKRMIVFDITGALV